MFYLGLDLGQRRDNTAIAIVEKIESRSQWGHTEFLSFHVRHAERVLLGTPYALVVERVKQIVQTQPLRGNCAIAVDATGVGAPVVEMMRRAELGCEISAVTITGGGTASHIGSMHHVPKADLWAGLTIMLERDELRISTGIPCDAALRRELTTLNSATGEAPAGEKDDLAIALALAVWKARRSGFNIGVGPKRIDTYDPVLRHHYRLL